MEIQEIRAWSLSFLQQWLLYLFCFSMIVSGTHGLTLSLNIYTQICIGAVMIFIGCKTQALCGERIASSYRLVDLDELLENDGSVAFHMAVGGLWQPWYRRHPLSLSFCLKNGKSEPLILFQKPFLLSWRPSKLRLGVYFAPILTLV